MRKIIIILSSLVLMNLTACSTNYLKPYQPPVQQGNIITDTMVKKIKVGMTKDQVINVMGEPVLNDPFDPNTWSYIYTYQPSRGKTQKKYLIIYFKNERVSNFTLDLPPPTKPKHN